MFKMKRLRTKILGGFTIVIALVFIMALLIFRSFSSVGDVTEEMIDEEIPLLISSENLINNVSQQVAIVRGYILMGESQMLDELQLARENRQEITENLLSLTDDPEVLSVIEDLDEWELLLQEAVEEKEADNATQSLVRLSESTEFTYEIYDVFLTITEEREQFIADAGKELNEVGDQAILSTVVISAIVLVIGVAIALTTSYMITRPIIAVKERMNALAAGD